MADDISERSESDERFGFRDKLTPIERQSLDDSIKKGEKFLIDYNNAIQGIIAKTKEEDSKKKKR